MCIILILKILSDEFIIIGGLLLCNVYDLDDVDTRISIIIIIRLLTTDPINNEYLKLLRFYNV